MSINLSVPEGAAILDLKPKLTVIGVGGAGGNAVNNMIRRELEGVDFVVANTDAQALEQSQAEARIQLGVNLTQGLGAGSQPEVGRKAAEEAIDEVLAALSGSHMAFIAAGMGGGTGTGAAPAIARAAKEAGILTVAVVTKPFQFEGGHRMRLAESGIQELEQYVDTLIIIPNQNLFRVATENTTFADAFAMADEVLYSGVRGVTDLMVMPGLINLDFADIRSVMSEMGKAMMGTGEAEGDRRALDAAEAAIANPLLDDTSMKGANGVLINITGGTDITLFEVDEAASRIRAEVDQDAYIIIGSAFDKDLQGKMRVSVVATGIDNVGRTIPQPTILQVTEGSSQAPHKLDEKSTSLSSQKLVDSVDMTSKAESVTETPLDRLVREAQATPKVDVERQVPSETASRDEMETKFDKKEIGVPHEKEKMSENYDSVRQINSVEKMPLAMPRRNADDAFIPLIPEATLERENLDDEESSAIAALGGDEILPKDENTAEKSSQDDRPSLFERVTRTGRAAIGRVVQENTVNDQIGAADVIGAVGLEKEEVTAGSNAGPKTDQSDEETVSNFTTSELELASSNLDTKLISEEISEEEDLLDIPAFLRRQAN